MRLPPGLCPGPRWGLRAPPKAPAGKGWVTHRSATPSPLQSEQIFALGYVDDIHATVDALEDKCNGLLGTHILSGCGTASYPNAWKRKGVRLASTHSTNLVHSWGGQCYAERLTDNRHCLLSVPLYCQKESTSLNAANHEIYRKSKRRTLLH